MRSFFIAILFVFFSTATRAEGLFGRSPKKVESSTTFQNIHPPELPSGVDFAGEKVPLEHFDIYESLEREMVVNTFWFSQTQMTIKLAHRYFPVIEPILRSQNIPDDFKYLCVAESGLQQLVSPAKAAGLWQIVPATGKELGLEVNEEIDERYHIEKSTLAACAFLKKAYDAFGSWSMAAAAYNMGMGGLTRQVLRQKTVSYYDMRLSEETTRYVFRILAFKIIMKNPEAYGFAIPKETFYPPLRYKEVAVKTAVESWADFALQQGTNYKMLKLFNPWLREASLTNKAGKTYNIKIPEEGFRVRK